MTTATRPRMPVEFSDDFARALHRETAWSVPDDQRTTCPIHLDWRSKCVDLHVRKAGR
ncbi:hypothetical protein ACFYZJ_37805 [Streptomyces sp. NPDC001848]|uniref:hypothetical protein n=1 Tax=Streptomyces sp. NPDC001848 TaxID=3364618 RepID=UPI0036C114E4